MICSRKPFTTKETKDQKAFMLGVPLCNFVPSVVSVL
jgi:hypothetical protein